MCTDRKNEKVYHRFDWTPSIIEDESESDFGSRSTSSTLSWTDEAEKEITQELQDHFEKFEAALYSETNGDDLTNIERSECELWKNHSPHLRITGKQVIFSLRDISEGEATSYPEDYEEVFASHSSVKNIGTITSNIAETEESLSSIAIKKIEDEETKEKFTNAVVDKLFERVWPAVLRKIGPFLNAPAEKLLQSLRHSNHNVKESKSFLVLDNNMKQTDRKMPSTHLFHRNAIGFTKNTLKHNNLKLPLQSLSTLNYPCTGRRFSSINTGENRFVEHNPVKGKLKRVPPASARLPKKKHTFNEYESETPGDEKCNDMNKTIRHGILPPIEALAITPKLPNKRASSAMLRFTKTQPRTRPNTSKNKTIFLTPIDDSDYSEARKPQLKSNEDGNANYASSLPPCSGKMFKRNKLPPRWRY